MILQEKEPLDEYVLRSCHIKEAIISSRPNAFAIEGPFRQFPLGSPFSFHSHQLGTYLQVSQESGLIMSD